jgi:hypothetical protein
VNWVSNGNVKPELQSSLTSILYYWFIHRLDSMVYERYLTPLKLLQLWMTTTWIAASTAEESSGASATAQNAVEVSNLSLHCLFFQHPRRSTLEMRPSRDRRVLSAAATSCDGFGLSSSPRDQPFWLLSRSLKTTCREPRYYWQRSLPSWLRLEWSIATVRHFTKFAPRKLTSRSNPFSLRYKVAQWDSEALPSGIHPKVLNDY